VPTRPAIAVILIGWVVAATGLFRRDLLPDYRITPPPDLRSIAVAGEQSTPTNWFLSVAEDKDLKNLRPVGRAFTHTERKLDGGTVLISNVSFDSDGLLQGTPFALKLGDHRGAGHLTVANTCEIDPSGNLRQFRVVIKAAGDDVPLMTIEAQVVGRTIEVSAQSPLPLLNWTKKPYPYEPRGMIQNGIGPTDRLPGLQVGQRWETEIVNPLTGRVEKVKTEVAGKHSIQWNNTLVTTLEVVQNLSPISARTWVRPDGLVLRQEVPLPFVRLILERAAGNLGDGGQSGTKAL